MEHLQCFKLCCGEESQSPISSEDIKTNSTQAFFFFFLIKGSQELQLVQFSKDTVKFLKSDAKKRSIFFPARGLIIWEPGFKNKGSKSESWSLHAMDGKT